jgi:hypothetical protein
MKTLLLLLALPALAAASIPDLGNSYWSCRTDVDVTVVVCPAGDGFTLDAAWPTAGGAPVDATIDAWVIDGGGNPVHLYPFEDIWLESPGLAYCTGGTVAAANTDPMGHTYFRILATGGHAYGDLRVMVNGDAIAGAAPNLRLASPDINGDGSVNIADLAVFVGMQEGTYDPDGDLDGNGRLDLTDAVLLFRHFTHACP